MYGFEVEYQREVTIQKRLTNYYLGIRLQNNIGLKPYVKDRLVLLCFINYLRTCYDENSVRTCFLCKTSAFVTCCCFDVTS